VAETRPKETTRRITNLKNQRAWVKDACQAGSFSLHDLQKRIGAIDGESSALESAQNRALGPVEVDHELAEDLVEVFTFWADLPRREKRDLLRSWQIRISVTKTESGKRGQIRPERVHIGSLHDVCIYKKMKHLGIV